MPDPLSVVGADTLAFLAHRAEDTEDDLKLMAVMAEVERRPVAEREAFSAAYIRQHTDPSVRGKVVTARSRHGR